MTTTPNEPMTDSEITEDYLITSERVVAELELHGVNDMSDVLECFDALHGHRVHVGDAAGYDVTLYDAGEVLTWLGY